MTNMFWMTAGFYLSVWFDMAADPYRQLKKMERFGSPYATKSV